ncbi:MAG TPA: flagellar biosynthesis protein FlhA [Polyangia bacterium]|nr:flagellar biosynthesis protein FlhA [Polyangia bacterium]
MSAPAEKPTGGRAELVLAIAVLGIIALLILPLPPLMLDGFLAISVSVSILILLISLRVLKPLDFSVFPSLLLITTLFRLGLNVATTRLILLDGASGTQAAGHVIEAFGKFAVGGNLIVGVVVFLILLVVNFSVITKGSGRVAEVAARFTLDALPGKQMSIDSDLAAGNIDDKQARERRAALEKEIEFFGAMDGASKFVRGDAVAGLVITAINIAGGLITGLLREKMSLSAAVDTYTILTIGDGLVSQIPALLVSTAAGIVVTRGGASTNLGADMGHQLLGNQGVLKHAAGVLVCMGLLPGMPFIAFASLAAVCFALSRRKPKAAPAQKPAEAPKTGQPERLADLINVDALELEVGHGLLGLIDNEKGGELPGRVTTLRRQIATDLGIVLPPCHLRDNLRLEPNEYKIRIRGNEIGGGVAFLDRIMVLDPGGAAPQGAGLEGVAAKEPAFGLPALWIHPHDRSRAEAAGLTVVDAASVVTTHLSELLRRNAHELVGRQEVQELLGAVGREAPKLVEDVVPGTITLGELVRVVRGVLRENLSIRDLRSILEGVADAAPRSKDTAFLVEQVRRRLFRQITAKVADPSGVVHALTLDRGSEDLLRKSLGQSDGEATLAPDLTTARRFIAALEQHAAGLAAAGKPTVVIAPPDLRRPLFDFGSRFVPDLWIITARELVPGTSVEPAGVLDLSPPPWSKAA